MERGVSRLARPVRFPVRAKRNPGRPRWRRLEIPLDLAGARAYVVGCHVAPRGSPSWVGADVARVTKGAGRGRRFKLSPSHACQRTNQGRDPPSPLQNQLLCGGFCRVLCRGLDSGNRPVLDCRQLVRWLAVGSHPGRATRRTWLLADDHRDGVVSPGKAETREMGPPR